jgi:hypothetical protein
LKHLYPRIPEGGGGGRPAEEERRKEECKSI